MENLIIRANERKKEDKGWIKIDTCFDKDYFKEKTGQALNTSAILSELCIKPNMGFVPHKHKNKDYIIIPLEGTLLQRTSNGKEFLIENRFVHFMQTGIGIAHYEYNLSFSDNLVCLAFEITPKKLNLEPVCETFKGFPEKNAVTEIKTFFFQQSYDNPIHIVSCSWGIFYEKRMVKYYLKSSKNAVLLYMIKGVIHTNGRTLTAKDTIFIWNTESFCIITEKKSDFIIFDFPCP